jgi:hypothetical protein
MPRRCVPIELPDGTVAYGMVSGPLTEEDRRAVLEFHEFLKCQTCPQRHKCALYGCAKEMSDATPERPIQESD